MAGLSKFVDRKRWASLIVTRGSVGIIVVVVVFATRQPFGRSFAAEIRLVPLRRIDSAATMAGQCSGILFVTCSPLFPDVSVP